MNLIKSVAALALGLLLLAHGLATADEKKDAKDKPGLTGTWEKKGGEMKIEFVDAEIMKLFPHGDKFAFAIVCSYKVEKDGLVKAKISDLEASEAIKEKAKGSVPVGLAFTFKWQAKNDVATVEDVKGENTDTLKSHLEGEFEKK